MRLRHGNGRVRAAERVGKIDAQPLIDLVAFQGRLRFELLLAERRVIGDLLLLALMGELHV